MLWMQTYLFYCSVRLGVIVIAFLTLLQLLTPAILLLMQGINLLDWLIDVFQNDDYYKKNVLINKLLNWIDEHPKNVIITLNIILFVHMGACFLAIYGAFKLSKYLLLPFIGLEFMRVIICLIFHIILMIILKKIINLGVLVAFTLLGGFLILYLAYNWCACVALFQILNLIRSHRYCELYGDDPFAPRLKSSYGSPHHFSYNTIENVHVISTPSSGDIDELKRKNFNNEKNVYNSKNNNRQIISVLPANNQFQHFADNSKKANLDIDISVNYGHWQWSELLVKGANTYKRNGLIGKN